MSSRGIRTRSQNASKHPGDVVNEMKQKRRTAAQLKASREQQITEEAGFEAQRRTDAEALADLERKIREIKARQLEEETAPLPPSSTATPASKAAKGTRATKATKAMKATKEGQNTSTQKTHSTSISDTKKCALQWTHSESVDTTAAALPPPDSEVAKTSSPEVAPSSTSSVTARKGRKKKTDGLITRNDVQSKQLTPEMVAEALRTVERAGFSITPQGTPTLSEPEQRGSSSKKRKAGVNETNE